MRYGIVLALMWIATAGCHEKGAEPTVSSNSEIPTLHGEQTNPPGVPRMWLDEQAADIVASFGEYDATKAHVFVVRWEGGVTGSFALEGPDGDQDKTELTSAKIFANAKPTESGWEPTTGCLGIVMVKELENSEAFYDVKVVGTYYRLNREGQTVESRRFKSAPGRVRAVRADIETGFTGPRMYGSSDRTHGIEFYVRDKSGQMVTWLELRLNNDPAVPQSAAPSP